jgi:hypothetical protein
MASYTGPLNSSKTNTVSHEPSFINSAPVGDDTTGTPKALKEIVKKELIIITEIAQSV